MQLYPYQIEEIQRRGAQIFRFDQTPQMDAIDMWASVPLSGGRSVFNPIRKHQVPRGELLEKIRQIQPLVDDGYDLTSLKHLIH